MLPFKKVIGPDYKESYKRKHQSKFLLTDPEVKKRFGVFKVTELLKEEDQEHFKKLYNYDRDTLDQYKLPLDKEEQELLEKRNKKRKLKIKDKSEKEKQTKKIEGKESDSVTRGKQREYNMSIGDEENQLELDNSEHIPSEEDPQTQHLKNVLLNIFDMNSKMETHKDDEEELYVKPNSKIAKTLEEIDNGEKAVQFFAMYGNTTPVKFIFCEKKKYPSHIVRPYDLVVVSGDKIQSEYFMITPNGITHVYNSDLTEIIQLKRETEKYPKNVAEFYTLADWMYQSTLFNILKRINYYKKFLPYKILKIWRNYNRFKKFLKVRDQLGKKLFVAKPAFVEKLVNVHGHLMKMINTKFHKIANESAWNDVTLVDFEDEQKKEVDAAKLKFKKLIEIDIFKCMRDLYRNISSRYKETRDIDEMENSKTLIELKNKSMYKLKIEKKMRKSLIKMAAYDVELFDKFIFVIDLMCVEMIFYLSKKNFKDMKRELYSERKDNNNTGIFTLTLSYPNTVVNLRPTDFDIEEKIKISFKNIAEQMTDIPRFVSIFQKKDYEMVFLNEATFDKNNINIVESERTLMKLNDNYDERIKRNLRDLVDKSKYYKKFLDSIVDKTFKEYSFAYEKTKTLLEVPYKEIQKEKEEWSVHEYLARNPKIEEVRQKLDDLKISSLHIEALRASYTWGIMNINSQSVKEELASFIKSSKEILEKEYVRKLYLELKKEINKDVEEGHELLAKRKYPIFYACEFKKAINNYMEKLNNLKKKVEKLDSLYSIIKSCKIESLSSLELSDYDSLRISHTKMEEDINIGLEEIKRNKDTMLAQLSQDTSANHAKIVELNHKVTNDFSSLVTDYKKVQENLRKVDDEMNECINNFNKYNGYLKVLEVITHEERDEDLENLKKNFELTNLLWMSIINSHKDFSDWRLLTISQMRNTKIEEKMKEYKSIALSLTQSLSENLSNKVLEFYHDHISQMDAYLPAIVALSSTSMTEKHYQEVFREMRENIYQDVMNSCTLGDLIENNSLLANLDKIETIAAASLAQEKIRKDLEKIEKDWQTTTFPVQVHGSIRDNKFIISSVEDVYNILDEHNQLITSALSSIHLGDLKDRVNKWDEEINTITRVIEEWLFVQKQWIYLENIFSAEDIKKQLPEASKNFTKVNKGFKDLMYKTEKNPLVKERCLQEGLLEQLMRFNKELDIIQKSLEDYLQTKRKAFPRFYFLSNDELLKILSQTRNPRAVQDYLNKCFDGIKTISFLNGSSNEITKMISTENESVALSKPVYAHENIEAWLNDLQDCMFLTVYEQMTKCLENYPDFDSPRKDWIFRNFPCQCTITVDQIMWANQVEESFGNISEDPLAVRNYLKKVELQIFELAELVSSGVSELKKSLLERLIIINVHSRDVLKDLIKEDVKEKNNFEWQKNLKFYWENNNIETNKERYDVTIRQTNSRFIYGYEYLGNPERMVITPLTDKCYITLTSALHLNFGGAPAGPAGTGKTETTKDLSKALAIKVTVFNCSDQLDFNLMERMFCGLAECGAWACFDEFNRIEVEVLSVIAQQIEIIQRALREKKFEINFFGKYIKILPRFGVFITMNPGYAGRSELPDNLKSLFRPVAMMIPDYALVSEVTLYSKGFKEAKELSIKMFQLFKLSSEQLSKQKHYDFGLRGIKSILSRAGYLKSMSPGEPEKEILIRAMKDSNLPKFLENDIELFLDIIKDLFPYTIEKSKEDQVFLDKVKEVFERENLVPTPSLVKKVNQLLDTMMVRLGNMVVGDAGTGKTTCYHILSKTLSELGKNKNIVGATDWYTNININILNPKSVTKSDLFMSKDEVTQTWEDGIIAKLMRMAEEEDKVINFWGKPGESLSKKEKSRRWIIFDGAVDPIWIEDMNTVLDDSRKLCLPDSSNIRIPKMMNLIFEVPDLKAASPATVSRCGMVFIEPHHVGCVPVITSWYKNYKDSMNKIFEEDGSKKNNKDKVELFFRHLDKMVSEITSIVPNLIKFVKRECKEKIPSVELNLTQSCLNLFSCFYNTEILNKTVSIEEISFYYLAFSVIWSIGANIDDDSRPIFSKRITDIFSKQGLKFEDDIYDGYVKDKASFINWSTLTDPFKYDRNEPFFNILVPTSDTVKYKYLMDHLNKKNLGCLFMGETGVGKSVIIMDYLSQLDKSLYLTKSSNFSAKTTSKNVFDTFKATINKNGNFQPLSGKKFIFFVDDINLPQLDEYGSQQPIEFIRQLIDNKVFYDEKKTLKKIKDVIFMAACAPPSGGRNKVTPRLFRHFHMIWMTELSNISMKNIFKSILEGFLENSKGLITETDDIIDAALDIYYKIRKEKLPTPSKSHYTFNLRDLSKVIQGMLQVSVNDISDRNMLMNLWIHETSRQFRDRLLFEDTAWFDKEITDIFHYKFNIDKNELMSLDKLTFTTLIDKSYKMVTDFDLLNKKVNDLLNAYNLSNRAKTGEMDIVFFTDAINHFCRIARILSQDRGNALLVGLGGSGRQSLVRLVGNFLSYKINYLQIGKGYGPEAFWKDLGKILMDVGMTLEKNRSKSQIFLFSDTQIIYESFLEDINNILNNGEVPNLFKEDELNLIFNTLKAVAKSEGRNESKEDVYQYFISNIKDQLHIALCFSPIGENFRNRCRQFPSIINCCTIDWFNIWPDEALKSVAEKQLNKIGAVSTFALNNNNLMQPLPEEMIQKLSCIFLKIHKKTLELSEKFYSELRRAYYITPTSYLSFLKLFNDIYAEKISQIPKQIQNYKLGIEKLDEANEMVKRLKEELIELEPKQIQKKKEVEEMIINLDKDTKTVDIERGKIKGDKDIVEIKRNEILKVKEECDSELNKVKPELEKAKAALSVLEEKDIRDLRSYPNPSINVVNLAKNICYVFDVKTEYSDFKILASDGKDFIRQCQNEELIIKKLNDPRKLRELRKLYVLIESINYNTVSQAAIGLKIWVGALLNYVEAYRIVKPKMDLLEKAKKELEQVEAELWEKSKVLREKEGELKNLQMKLENAQKSERDLSHSIQLINIKSKRAVRLVDGLKDEGERWKDNILNLEKEEKNLMANVILSSAVVSYSGPFTTEYRKELLLSVIQYLKEQEINYSVFEGHRRESDVSGIREPVFNLQNILCEQMQIRDWNYAGLPADDLSVENAIMTVRSMRWPLIIDPQMQANRWIKNYYRSQGLRVYKITDKNLFNRLKDCIMSGYPCLVENVEQTFDSALEPILQKNTTKTGASTLLILGGTEKPIQYINTFKLFMTSKLANPHYLPEISIKTTLINFTVTQKGLEDQLLVDVVKHERPDLEAQKDALVLSINENRKLIKDLEQVILMMVRDANNEILENDILVNKLAQSKEQSHKIKVDLKEAETTANKINKERRVYRPIAVRGSIIYFVIASLANIDSMYNYSLDYFSKLFLQRLEKSEQSPSVEKRIDILIEDITLSFFEKISRGLFEKDKLLYSFLLWINVHLSKDSISMAEWNFFLRGGSQELKIDQNHSYYKNNLNRWISLENYKKLISLKECSIFFYDIEHHLNENNKNEVDIKKWQEFLNSEHPHLCRFPENFEKAISDFYRLLIIKLLREEKLIFAIKDFIRDTRFLESPPFNIQAAFEDSLKTTPLIFILSPGANPVRFLREFAQDKFIPLNNLSLGQGQGELAKQLILRSKEKGDWVCLENCHLARSWMPKLEEILEDLNDNESNIHPNYRLWLTSMPSDKFPVSILQSGVKITNEPPKGIKANLKGTFQNLKDEDIHSDTKPAEMKKLIFTLAFFHGIILERRKFGPLGWNIPYEWMNSDFEASKLHLKMYVEAHEHVPFKILQYLVGVINYGGRVTDDKDGKLILAILNKYFNNLLFDDYFKFSESGVYYAPNYKNIADLHDYLEKLPLDDEPEVFGLHANANIVLQNKLVREFMEPLIAIQPRDTSSRYATKPDEEVLNMKHEIYNKLYSSNVLSGLETSKPNPISIYENGKNKKSPLGNFLLQESDKFINLIKIIKSTLNTLELAVKGLIVMSPELEKVYQSFLNKQVPKLWEDNAYLSMKPLSNWIVDFIERVQFMNKWLVEGPPKSFWISAFFFPQGFNTAVLQTYARKTNEPIDSLTFRTNILKYHKNDADLLVPDDGLNIHGLFLQGASWEVEKGVLRESTLGKMWHEMPCMWY